MREILRQLIKPIEDKIIVWKNKREYRRIMAETAHIPRKSNVNTEPNPYENIVVYQCTACGSYYQGACTCGWWEATSPTTVMERRTYDEFVKKQAEQR